MGFECSLNTARVVIFFGLVFSLNSCGVYQATQDKEGYVAAGISVNPVIAITGYNESPDDKDLEEDLPYYSRLIRERNAGKMTSDRSRIIRLGMEKIFRLRRLQVLPESEIYKLFGSADEKTETSSSIIYRYRVRDHKFPVDCALVISKAFHEKM